MGLNSNKKGGVSRPRPVSALHSPAAAVIISSMIITHHGGQCFKVSFGDTTLAFDPIAKQSKLDAVKFGSDVALVSLNHPNCNGVEQVAHGSKQPFVINGPGEYEVGDVTVRGWGVKTTYDKVERFNTIYQVQLEGMNLIFLGALGDPDIDASILGEFGDVDVLFVPIGGGDVMEVPQASKLATKIEVKRRHSSTSNIAHVCGG